MIKKLRNYLDNCNEVLGIFIKMGFAAIIPLISWGLACNDSFMGFLFDNDLNGGVGILIMIIIIGGLIVEFIYVFLLITYAWASLSDNKSSDYNSHSNDNSYGGYTSYHSSNDSYRSGYDPLDDYYLYRSHSAFNPFDHDSSNHSSHYHSSHNSWESHYMDIDSDPDLIDDFFEDDDRDF